LKKRSVVFEKTSVVFEQRTPEAEKGRWKLRKKRRGVNKCRQSAKRVFELFIDRCAAVSRKSIIFASKLRLRTNCGLEHQTKA
jgi:hypothetical protein